MKEAWKPYLRLGVTAFLLYLAITYWHTVVSGVAMAIQAAGPLLLGGAIAYVANILMSFYEQKIRLKYAWWKKIRRPACLILALATVVLVIYLLLRLIVPQLVSCFEVLLSALPGAITSFYNWLEETFGISEYLHGTAALPQTSAEWEKTLSKGLQILLSGVGGVMNVAYNAITSVVGGLITLFLSLVFTFYILTGKEKLAGQIRRLSLKVAGKPFTQKAEKLLRVLDKSFHSYIVGQCLEAVILGTLCGVGMAILQLPYALMIGALVGVTALIPVAGAYIGAAVGAVMIFSVSPVKALIFLVYLVVLQQVEGNVIYPRTVGSSLGLPGIWVLAAVMLGGGLMGVMGMMIFVPVTAAAYQLLKTYVEGKPLE